MSHEDLFSVYEEMGLLYPQELEDWNAEPSGRHPFVREELLLPTFRLPTPEAEHWEGFKARKPGMGLPKSTLDKFRKVRGDMESSSEYRQVFELLRETLLRFLISCDGVDTIIGLVEVLEKEQETGVPGPIPLWYQPSTVRFPGKNFYSDSSLIYYTVRPSVRPV
jgi:hypothetical protein